MRDHYHNEMLYSVIVTKRTTNKQHGEYIELDFCANILMNQKYLQGGIHAPTRLTLLPITELGLGHNSFEEACKLHAMLN